MRDMTDAGVVTDTEEETRECKRRERCVIERDDTEIHGKWVERDNHMRAVCGTRGDTFMLNFTAARHPRAAYTGLRCVFGRPPLNRAATTTMR